MASRRSGSTIWKKPSKAARSRGFGLPTREVTRVPPSGSASSSSVSSRLGVFGIGIVERVVQDRPGCQSRISSSTASLPCMQWFTVPAPRRPDGDASRMAVTPGTHCGRRIGDVRYSQTSIGGAADSVTYVRYADLSVTLSR